MVTQAFWDADSIDSIAIIGDHNWTHAVFTYALYDGHESALTISDNRTFLDPNSLLWKENIRSYQYFLQSIEELAHLKNETITVLVVSTQSDRWLDASPVQIPASPGCYDQAVQEMRNVEQDFPHVHCLHGFINVNVLGDMLLLPLIQQFFVDPPPFTSRP